MFLLLGNTIHFIKRKGRQLLLNGLPHEEGNLIMKNKAGKWMYAKYPGFVPVRMLSRNECIKYGLSPLQEKWERL